MPDGTVPVKGATKFALFNATRGGRKPLLVLSSSNNEFELIVFGLLPILTWALTDRVNKSIMAQANRMIGFFITTDGFANKIFSGFVFTYCYLINYKSLHRTA